MFTPYTSEPSFEWRAHQIQRTLICHIFLDQFTWNEVISAKCGSYPNYICNIINYTTLIYVGQQNKYQKFVKLNDFSYL